MPISTKQIRSIPLITFSHQSVGLIKTPVIDPATGKVLAYQLKKSAPNLLSPLDIQNATPFRIIVNDQYELHQVEDLIRVQRVFEDKITIIKKPVQTEGGFKLGKCVEIMIDLKQSMLYGIVVKKQIFPLFPKLTLLIKRDSIVDINKKAIVVKDSLIKLPIFSKAQKMKSASPTLSATSTSSMSSEK